jgi:hypothetical protein
MGTRIEQNSNGTVVATNDDQPPACNAARAEIAGLGNFRFVPGINPALIEDTGAFKLEILVLGESSPVNAEDARPLIIDNEIIDRCTLHVFSPQADRGWLRARSLAGGGA